MDEHGFEYDSTFDVESEFAVSNSGRFTTREKIMAGLMALFLLVATAAVCVAVFALLSSGDSGESEPYHNSGKTDYSPMYDDEKMKVFRSPTMVVHAGRHNELLYTNIERPAGDVAVHLVRVSIKNAINDAVVPLTQVYNHHIFLADYEEAPEDNDLDFRMIRGLGAESLRDAFPLPEPFAFVSEAERKWAMSAHLVNQWGMASGASMKVYIEYEIYYREVHDLESMLPYHTVIDVYGQGLEMGLDSSSEETHNSAEVDVAHDLPNEFVDPSQSFDVLFSKSTANDRSAGEVGFDVPGDGESGDLFIKEASFTWTLPDTLLVWGAGHVHIGSKSITLFDDTNNKEIFTSYVEYNDSGFIVSVSDAAPMYELTQGMVLRLRAEYDNSDDYRNVMALVSLSTTPHLSSLEEFHALP